MPADAALLADVPFFQLLDDVERQELAAQLDSISYPAGALIFQYGEPGDALYLVRSGKAEVFFKDDTGQRIILESPETGDVFGELSLLDGGPRTASVQAVTDVDLLRLDRGDLDLFLRRRPAAAMDLLAAMGRRLRFTAEKLRHTASRNPNEEIQDRRTRVEKIADWIAVFSGSIAFLMIHAVLFALWIGLNLDFVHRLPVDWIQAITGFDPFPYGLLTMCVSLEAIFLSVFVLLSQNRQAANDRIRSDIEYDVNLKAEMEIAHLHEKVDRLISETSSRLSRIEQAGGAPKGSAS